MSNRQEKEQRRQARQEAEAQAAAAAHRRSTLRFAASVMVARSGCGVADRGNELEVVEP